MRDLITSGVKTANQVAVAAIVAWAFSLGFEVDAVALEGVLFALITGLVAFGLNWLTAKWPIVGRVLSFGLTKTTPTYTD